jgi:L-2-hydroxyglutarate oxidase LhgO
LQRVNRDIKILSVDTEITIIGAGVVGLAIAAKLSATCDSLFVVEKHTKFGQESSSRNSEVVHSGIYYPRNSLKAELCVQGREALYSYCNQHDIAYRKCGKLIVATTEEEVEQIEGIVAEAQKNGVNDGVMVDRDRIFELEPHIDAIRGVFFPSTGIVDSHGFMKQLESDAILNGANFVYGAEVYSCKRIRGGYEISMHDADGEDYTFTSQKLINAAGLSAGIIAQSAGIADPEYSVHFWKGEYFSVGNGKHKLINRLIYPVPEKNRVGLGIHTTVDLDGRVKLGPNALYLEKGVPEYSVDPEHAGQFLRSVHPFLPFLEPGDLYPDQAGVRPKLQKPGDPVRDFLIREESDRNLPGFINLIGIESPGLTASLAIADYVYELVHTRMKN